MIQLFEKRKTCPEETCEQGFPLFISPSSRCPATLELEHLSEVGSLCSCSAVGYYSQLWHLERGCVTRAHIARSLHSSWRKDRMLLIYEVLWIWIMLSILFNTHSLPITNCFFVWSSIRVLEDITNCPRSLPKRLMVKQVQNTLKQ